MRLNKSEEILMYYNNEDIKHYEELKKEVEELELFNSILNPPKKSEADIRLEMIKRYGLSTVEFMEKAERDEKEAADEAKYKQEKYENALKEIETKHGEELRRILSRICIAYAQKYNFDKINEFSSYNYMARDFIMKYVDECFSNKDKQRREEIYDITRKK